MGRDQVAFVGARFCGFGPKKGHPLWRRRKNNDPLCRFNLSPPFKAGLGGSRKLLEVENDVVISGRFGTVLLFGIVAKIRSWVKLASIVKFGPQLSFSLHNSITDDSRFFDFYEVSALYPSNI